MRIVWFSLQQSLVGADQLRHTVCRVDCCHGEVHRHVFRENQGEVDRKHLFTIPVHGQTLVEAEYERYYADLVGNWEARVREWRSS